MSPRDMTLEQRAKRLLHLRGREAARKMHTSRGRLIERPLDKQIAFALFDPGAITPRGEDYTEPLYLWQARAVTCLLDAQPQRAVS